MDFSPFLRQTVKTQNSANGACLPQAGENPIEAVAQTFVSQKLCGFSAVPKPRTAEQVARTCRLGPRLFVVNGGRTADLQNRSALLAAGGAAAAAVAD